MTVLRVVDDITMRGRRPSTVAHDMSRLTRRVAVVASGCWEFTGSLNRKGYGLFSCQGNGHMLAHRAAWTLRFGDPGDLCVLHRCDNPPCVRPSHLFLGTIADNNADMDFKGRRNNPGLQGERHHQAILTDADIVEIRRMYATGDHLQREIADLFGVGQTRISDIVMHKSWKHVA